MTRVTPIDNTPAYDKPPGPIGGRKCRDVFWLILFGAYWAGMAILAILAIVNGNPNRIIVPRDSAGNFCGLKNADLTNGRDLTSRPFIYSPSGQQHLDQGMDYARIFIQDFMTTWQWMLGALGACVVVCFIWLFVLRFLAGPLTYLTLLAVEGGLGALAWYTYGLWQTKKTANALVASPSAADTQSEQVNMGLFIAMCCLAGIFLLMMIALRKRIRIAIQIIKETSKAVGSMPLIVLFPLVPYVGIIVLTVYYVIIAIYIETSNDVTSLSALGVNQSITYIKYFQWYHLFGFLWTLAFLVAINQTTIAGAIATWYWSRDKAHLPRFTVLKAFWRTIRYSLGSLAFGSLLIAITQLIRIILAYVQRQLRNTNNKVAMAILTCLQCCFYCLEKFIKFLNKNAYIMIAVNGTSFCTSARTAAELLLRNAFRLVAVDFVSTFLLFLSKVVVAGGTAGGLYVLLNHTNTTGVTSTQAVWVVALVVLVAAWMVTVFLSFCEDSERNDGTPARPYFMSEGLAF
ncbi:plasma-membrane choline transporter-domain-containing protein [Catenaria anguillulae PL171]|uniref:Protein PNS1 n=1 Tax=Catenaria anguillulae PL171 TaxID=765915 RepID=A0A1Y2I0G6_9FUNG|nr:plasma-membrane choline transporter-domain-containing protein [Catenaria anguillulae PL171]